MVSAGSVAQRASWEASPLSASQVVWGRLGADGVMWSEGSVPRPKVDTNVRADCLKCGSKGDVCGRSSLRRRSFEAD